MAEDGTEIEEEYLDIIDQKSVIMLLEKQEKWTDQGKQSRIVVWLHPSIMHILITCFYSLLIFIVAHLIYQIQCNKMALNSWSNSLTYLFYLEYIADKEESPRESPKVLDTTTSGGENLCKQRTLKRDLSLGPPIKVSTEKYDLLPRKLVSCLRE